jgi:Cellulose binding domain.
MVAESLLPRPRPNAFWNIVV